VCFLNLKFAQVAIQPYGELQIQHTGSPTEDLPNIRANVVISDEPGFSARIVELDIAT
jgi:hypothetical protein